MFTQSLISLVALSTVLLPTALAAPGPAWIRRQQDAQSSLTLDPASISEALKQDGQGANPDPGQVRSLTSSNNFINFCLGPLANGVPLTNGKQITTGSCNQTPMGRIISLDKAPRSKFVFPKNGDESIEENAPFTVQMKILNMETGNFVNAQANYYAAPQQVNGQGIVIGHSHVVIERLPSLQTTEPLDPTKFEFFKGLNNVAANDILTADVSSGLKAGVFRICSINTAANHQPCLVSNAQHGALDDCSYFTIKPKGANNNNNNNNNNNASTTASVAATANVSNTQSASASASATASVSESSSTSETASASESASSSNATPDASSTESSSAAQSTSSTESSSAADSSSAAPSQTDAPEATPSQGNNNQNQDGGNNQNQGGDQGNNQGNQGNNQGNQGNNQGNQGNNQGNNQPEPSPSAEPSSSAEPSPAEPSSPAAEQPSPSAEAPSSSADSSAAAPSSTGAPEAAPSQGNNDQGADQGNNQANQGNNQGGNDNQGESKGN